MGLFIENREDLFKIVRGLITQGKKVVFTNGAFDLVHVGHIRSLTDARSRGDFLVVAVNTDASVRKQKGSGLPVIPLKERVEVLCALSCVDYVTSFAESTADEILAYLKPSIHAKGTDYTEETVPERDTVLEYGGAIAIVGDPKGHSTTSVIDRIRKLPRKKSAAPVKAVAKKKSANAKTAAKKKSAAPAKTATKKKSGVSAKAATKKKVIKKAAKTTGKKTAKAAKAKTNVKAKTKTAKKKTAPKNKGKKKVTRAAAPKSTAKKKKSGQKGRGKSMDAF